MSGQVVRSRGRLAVGMLRLQQRVLGAGVLLVYPT